MNAGPVQQQQAKSPRHGGRSVGRKVVQLQQLRKRSRGDAEEEDGHRGTVGESLRHSRRKSLAGGHRGAVGGSLRHSCKRSLAGGLCFPSLPCQIQSKSPPFWLVLLLTCMLYFIRVPLCPMQAPA